VKRRSTWARVKGGSRKSRKGNVPSATTVPPKLRRRDDFFGLATLAIEDDETDKKEDAGLSASKTSPLCDGRFLSMAGSSGDFAAAFLAVEPNELVRVVDVLAFPDKPPAELLRAFEQRRGGGESTEPSYPDCGVAGKSSAGDGVA
jgi:hypothetical protein